MLTPVEIAPYLEERRMDLVRFAELQLRDRALAEDAVQETLLAALTGHQAFARRAEVKTWVYGILKRKIVDELRKRGRELVLSDVLADEEDEGDALDRLFNVRGFWQQDTRPSRWVDPEESLQQQQFWRVFEACLTHLSARNAQVFMMREMLELDTPEICSALRITESNCWVILHRTRLALRHCVSHQWFENL